MLAAAGLPLEFLALTLPISTVADMARTLTNVTAAGVATTIVARREGRLDDAVFLSRGVVTPPRHRPTRTGTTTRPAEHDTEHETEPDTEHDTELRRPALAP